MDMSHDDKKQKEVQKNFSNEQEKRGHAQHEGRDALANERIKNRNEPEQAKDNVKPPKRT